MSFSTNRMSSFTEFLQNLPPMWSHCTPLQNNIFLKQKELSHPRSFNSKVIHKWRFFKSGDRYSLFFTIIYISYWVSDKKKGLSLWQMIYNKLEKYLSLSIYRNIRRKFFFQYKITAILSKKENNYWYI